MVERRQDKPLAAGLPALNVAVQEVKGEVGGTVSPASAAGVANPGAAPEQNQNLINMRVERIDGPANLAELEQRRKNEA